MSNLHTGHKVRKVRELKGITQDYVAKALGVKQNTYSRMETGQIKIQEEQLDKIAAALDVEKEEIEAFDDKLAFTNCTQTATVIGVNHILNNHFSEELKQVYEDLLAAKEKIIAQLEDKIKQLEAR